MTVSNKNEVEAGGTTRSLHPTQCNGAWVGHLGSQSTDYIHARIHEKELGDALFLLAPRLTLLAWNRSFDRPLL
jgi:hypothetical protein